MSDNNSIFSTGGKYCSGFPNNSSSKSLIYNSAWVGLNYLYNPQIPNPTTATPNNPGINNEVVAVAVIKQWIGIKNNFLINKVINKAMNSLPFIRFKPPWFLIFKTFLFNFSIIPLMTFRFIPRFIFVMLHLSHTPSLLWYKNIITNPITKPIKPEASTNEKPIKAHLIHSAFIDGLREIEYTNDANINPTPIATPEKHNTPNAHAILAIAVINIVASKYPRNFRRYSWEGIVMIFNLLLNKVSPFKE